MATIETTTSISLDMLSSDSVSVVKKEMAEINGQVQQIGQDWRRAFVNSAEGRSELIEFLPEPYLTSVLTVWGASPTIINDTPPSFIGR